MLHFPQIGHQVPHHFRIKYLRFSSIQVFHLYITFSLMAGVGMGFAVNPCMTILSRHFNKYNKVAVGISMCGVGVSSFIWPPVMKALEETYGWRGAILMMAGIYSHTIIFTSLYRPVERTKPQNSNEEHEANLEICDIKDKMDKSDTISHKDALCSDTKKSIQNISNWTGDNKTETAEPKFIKHLNNKDTKNIFMASLLLLKNLPFACFCLHFTLFFFPVMIIYTHFGNYVLSHGFSKQDVVYLYMTMGIAMTLARVLTGVITSFLKMNSSTVVMVCKTLIGVVTLMVPFIQSFTLYIVYSVLFCLFITPTYILCLPIVMESVPPKQIATTYGIMNLITVPASILGAPFAGKSFNSVKLCVISIFLLKHDVSS